MGDLNKHDLTSSQLRMLRALENNMKSFFYADSETYSEGMIFALDNGWTVHAVDCFAGTGATDKQFDRIFRRLTKSVGLSRWDKINRNAAAELCAFARIQICNSCNHHAFSDPSEDQFTNCISCRASFPKIA